MSLEDSVALGPCRGRPQTPSSRPPWSSPLPSLRVPARSLNALTTSDTTPARISHCLPPRDLIPRFPQPRALQVCAPHRFYVSCRGSDRECPANRSSMTQLFRDMRLYGNSECRRLSPSRGLVKPDRLLPVILLLLSATVLGITAYWASIFLPNIRREHLPVSCLCLSVSPFDS